MHLYKDEIDENTPASVVIQLEDDVDAVRGDMIARIDNLPNITEL